MEAAWHPVPGGTARVAIDLGSALQRRDGVDVTAVAAAHRREPGADWLPTVPVTHHRVPRPLLYEAWSRGPFPRLRTSSAVDVVHSTTIVAPPVGATPLVVSVHDLAFRRHPDRFPARARRLFERSWRRVLERADAVICPSAATSADLRAGGLDADRLHLLPLGHDPLDVAEDDRARVRQRHGLEGPFVLASGTLEPRKNVPALVAAFGELATHHDAHLVLAGPQGWGVDPAALLEQLNPGVRERVVITGAVSKLDLAALYSEAAVFCYPSLLEGFGLPVLEAMSYGAPVVTSRGTATEEVAGDAALTVDPQQPLEIAAALAAVLGDPGEGQRLTAAGLERSAGLRWDEVAAATVRLYEQLL